MAENDIYHEIEEDIRRQRLLAVWQENRVWIIGSIVAAIITTAALVTWRQVKLAQNMEQTAALLAAMDTKDAEELARYASAAPASHALLAQFAAAELHARAGARDKAAVIYDDIAQMSALPFIGVNAAWRDLAALYSVMNMLDTGDAKDLHKRLDALSGKGDTWRWSALEMKALLHAREDELDAAIETLEIISTADAAPQDMRSRALTLREVYAGRRAASAKAGDNNG